MNKYNYVTLLVLALYPCIIRNQVHTHYTLSECIIKVVDSGHVKLGISHQHQYRIILFNLLTNYVATTSSFSSI